MPDRSQRIYDLYQAALTLKLEDRKAFLHNAEPELRAEVEALLEQNLTLLDRPAWEYENAKRGE